MTAPFVASRIRRKFSAVGNLSPWRYLWTACLSPIPEARAKAADVISFAVSQSSSLMVDDGNHNGDLSSTHWVPTAGPRLGYPPTVAKVPYPNGLAECMARAGIKDPALAVLAGTTKQQIHKLRHGERKLTVQWAKILAPHLECSWQELIEGPTSPADIERADLVAMFEAMDARDRQTLLRVARSMQTDPAPNGESSPRPKQQATGCIVPVTRLRVR